MNALGATLPYDQYFPASGLFKQKDGSLGAVFEVYPAESGPIPVEQVIRSVQALESWFMLPSNCLLQILYDHSFTGGQRVFVSIRREPSTSSREMRKFSKLVETFEGSSTLLLRRLTAADLVDLLKKFFNPRTYVRHQFTPIDPNISLSDQVIWDDQKTGKLKTRRLTLRTLPQFAYPGGLAFLLRLQFPLQLSLNFGFPKKNPNVERSLRLSFEVTVTGYDDADLESRVRAAILAFHHELSCDAFVDDAFPVEASLNSLPLNFYPNETRREHAFRLPQSEAAKYGPVFGTFSGLTDSFGLGVTPENNLVDLGHGDPHSPGHTVVIGNTVEDRHAVISSCIQTAKRIDPAPLIFMLRNSAEKSGADEYFDDHDEKPLLFLPGRSMPINPFRGVFDEERITFLARFILAGVELASSQLEPRRSYEAAIRAAIRAACGAKHTATDLVVADGRVLKGRDSASLELTIVEIAKHLSVDALERGLLPFLGNGIYAKAMEGASEGPKNRARSMFTYDLSALSGHPILGALMALAVLGDVARVMAEPESKGRRGYFVLEDVNVFGRDTRAGTRLLFDFIDSARRLNLDLIGLAPEVKEYFETAHGRIFWGKAAHIFFLPESGDGMSQALEWDAGLDLRRCGIIEALRRKKGEYLDIFHFNRNERTESVFRLFLSPLERWGQTSKMSQTTHYQSGGNV